MRNRSGLAWVLAILMPLSTAAAPTLEEETAEARTLANQLIQELGAELKQQLSAVGPAGAIGVCKDLAPRLAGNLSRQTGYKVSRVSLRARNAMIGQPDAWEQRGLLQFDQRVTLGETADGMERVEFVEEPQGRYFRYLRALPTQPLCVSCHGDAAALGEDVKARLTSEYPKDKAVGYRAGTIRGAVSIKKPLF